MSDLKHEVIPHAAVSEPARGIMHPLVERMLAASPTPETLKQVLDLQREWERGEAKKAYTRALVEMKGELPAWIKRDKEVKYGDVKYTHTSLAAAMEAVQPTLTKYGFSLSWTPATTAGQVSVTATLAHRDGHSESATIAAPPDTKGSKNAAQAVASTVTLLQRYTALSLLGIATADMVDPKPDGSEGAKPEGGKVDTARNMRAMAEISKTHTREQAEAHVGKPIQQWTAGDLDKLKAWIAPPPAQAPAEDREPGADEDVNVSPMAPQKPAGPYITERERLSMFACWRKAGKSDELVKEHLLFRYGIEKSNEVPATLFNEIYAWCEDKSTNPVR